MNAEYSFDDQTGVWVRAGGPPKSNYSDGSDEERYLRDALRQCKDLSLFSREIASLIRSWPSQYHLSSERANLLRGFDFSASEKILELGCGCGAVSRFLGETGKAVTAVEQSPLRAEIAAQRCRDLRNVQVICDNWQQFVTEEQFDVVVLVGVLEYARINCDRPDPVGALLEKCRSLLRPSGVLLLAIENQLGLKYFAGHFEDHTGTAYAGLEDLYQPGQAVTFGKAELRRRVSTAGFTSTLFFYPYPDYKLPRIILADRAFEHPEFSACDLLARTESKTYIGSPTLGFDERLARRALERNGLLSELANSFLVVAGIGPAFSISWDWIAKQYSPRGSEGRSTSVTFSETQHSVSVTKELDPSAQAARLRDATEAKQDFRHQRGTAPYFRGTLYDAALGQLLARGATISEIAEWSKPWFELLDRSRLAQDRRYLPEDFVDCVPFNFIVEDNGHLQVIDQEWISRLPIPAGWVIIRGLAYSLAAAPRKGVLAGMTYREAIREIAALAGVRLTEDDFTEAQAWEEKLQTYVFGRRHDGPPESTLRALLESAVLENPYFAEERIVHSLRKELAAQTRAQEAETQAEAAMRTAEENVRQSLQARKTLLESLERSLKRRQILSSAVRALQISSSDLESENENLRQQVITGRIRSLSMGEAAAAAIELAESGEAEHPSSLDRHRLKKKNTAPLQPPIFVTEDGHTWSERELERLKRNFFREDYYRTQLDGEPDSTTDLFQHFLTVGWKLQKNPHPAFNIRYYLRERPDLYAARLNPILHYFRYGVGEKLRPHPLFDTAYYAETYAELFLEGEHPFEHYVRHGLTLQTNPCAYFQTHYYLSQNPSVIGAGVNPLEHYITSGWKESQEPCPLFDGNYFLKNSGLILEADDTPLGAYVESLANAPGGAGDPHPLFHTRYYSSRFASADGKDPLLDFLSAGPRERVSPCPLFDVEYYLTANPDVRHLTVHPFMHFLNYGARELRNPHLFFDSRYYAEQVRRKGEPVPADLLRHYFCTPVKERLNTHPLFDRKWYARKYRHLIPAHEDPFLHFICIGKDLWLSPNRDFNSALYLRRYEDVRQSGMSPIEHYVRFGYLERRKTE